MKTNTGNLSAAILFTVLCVAPIGIVVLVSILATHDFASTQRIQIPRLTPVKFEQFRVYTDKELKASEANDFGLILNGISDVNLNKEEIPKPNGIIRHVTIRLGE